MSNTPTITRRLEFDAGHRVFGHESKCATLHGHRYVVEVTAQAAKLDSVGRVIDFSVLKERIGAWLDEKWDHNVIVFEQDEAKKFLAIARGDFNIVAKRELAAAGKIAKQVI